MISDFIWLKALYEKVTVVHTPTQQVLNYKSHTTVAGYYSVWVISLDAEFPSDIGFISVSANIHGRNIGIVLEVKI